MKLLKTAGVRGRVLPKMRIMPKWSELTGMKKGELSLDSGIKRKKKRKSVFQMFKEV